MLTKLFIIKQSIKWFGVSLFWALKRGAWFKKLFFSLALWNFWYEKSYEDTKMKLYLIFSFHKCPLWQLLGCGWRWWIGKILKTGQQGPELQPQLGHALAVWGWEQDIPPSFGSVDLCKMARLNRWLLSLSRALRVHDCVLLAISVRLFPTPHPGNGQRVGTTGQHWQHSDPHICDFQPHSACLTPLRMAHVIPRAWPLAQAGLHRF